VKSNGDTSQKYLTSLADYSRLVTSFADFNPTYGQGMSSAAQQASLLFDLLCSDDRVLLTKVATDFLTKAENLVADPWAMSAVPDFV
jgi:hypothetical protein